jgi:hypothetical protein
VVQAAPEENERMDNKQHYLPWIAIWGAVFGVISGIPLINCCCFLWFPLAGLLSVMSIANKANASLSFAEGAVVGLLSGAIAGVLSGVFAGAINAAAGSAVLDFYRNLPNIPPDLMRQMEAQYSNPAASFFQSCCLFTVVGPAFGAIGGLIGSPIFKKGPGGGMPQPQAY